MRTLCNLSLLLLVLSGCNRSPYEQQVFEHAKVQAALNAENFARARETPPREPLRSTLECISIEQASGPTLQDCRISAE